MQKTLPPSTRKLYLYLMSSPNIESNSENSSSDESYSSIRHLSDETQGEISFSTKRTRHLFETISTQIPLIVATTLAADKQPHGGYSNGRRYIRRDREQRHNLIVSDYFMEKVDAVGKRGLSPLQKMITALRMLAYGCSADILDNYVQIGETTAIESLKEFCDSVIGVFEDQYLRKPNQNDIANLLREGEERGFPEVVASKDLWIWHAFFGMAGSSNDINVLNRSLLFDDIVNGVAPPREFVVQNHHYHMGYYLSDGIYPSYATLIQTISEPFTNKERLFAKCQESVRKDVERAFGVLQSM